MDILYIVGKGFSDWHNNELRYSLRSIAKYGRNVGRVFIAGYIPYFVNQENVVCLPVKDTTRNKHYNILSAIEYAVEHSDIGERFVYSSDDHYYTRPTDFDKYPVYWRGVELPIEQKNNTWYQRTLHSTRECLEAFGLPTRHYAWHGNTHFCRSLFEQRRMELVRTLAKQLPDCCEPSCLMLNYWEAVSPDTMPKRIKRDDAKLGEAKTAEDIQRIANSREVISSTDAVGNALRYWLEHEYTQPCKYEYI